MVKAKKNKGKNNEASGAAPPAKAPPAKAPPAKAGTADPPAKPIPTSADLTPNKKIRKDRKPKKNKREGASDAVAVPTTPASAGGGGSATPASNSKAVTPASNNKGEQQKVEKSSGFIFMCNSRTKPECYRHRVFAMPKGKAEVVQRIKPGTRLFLYDFDLRLLYGIYRATSQGGLNLVPQAFGGAFPAQVKFKIDKDCLPLPESTFKEAILENYDSKNKFQPDLNSKQVHKLLALFQPITAAPQPAPPQFVDDRRAQPQFVEERRAPPPHHVPLPADSHRPAHIPPAYLPPSDDPYSSSAHLTVSRLPHLDEPYRPAHLTVSRLPPSDDPYESRRLLAPPHLPLSEDPYHSRATAPDSRYISMHAPPANDPYYSAARHVHDLPSMVQNNDPYYPPSSRYLYRQPEAPRSYYPENPAPIDRMEYRVPVEVPVRDPNTTLAGDYLLRRESDVNLRAERVEEAYLADHRLAHLPSYRVRYVEPPAYGQAHDIAGHAQPSSSVPVSSLYSFAGAAPSSAYR